ncbi:MAG: glycine cleavage system aminomethyltransferase GcvT [Nitrososphaeria archaeon]
MGKPLKRTHLYNFHKQNGRLIEFAGFEHALYYEGIVEEHLAVRNSVGVFDVTHMGRAVVEGEDAVFLLEKLLPRKVSNMSNLQGRYAFFVNPNGGIIDDLTLFKLEEKRFLIVYNAGNREKDFEWIRTNSAGYNVKVTDVSDEVLMLAVQGPNALKTLQKISDKDLSKIKRYWCDWVRLGEYDVLASRTGYTGEDGFELYLWNTPLFMNEKAENFLLTILDAGREYNIKPCGLGARDTLRLEAGMCLHDHDLNESISPLEAGFEGLIDFDKPDFIGKSALIEQKEKGVTRRRVCIKLLEKGVPREGCELYHNNEFIGKLTSGTYSPLLNIGIGMGYVLKEFSEVGTRLKVKIRERYFDAEVVNPPFYDPNKYGYKRVCQQ